MPLVEEALLEELGERPPDRLDERLVVRDVRFVEVDPETDPLGEVLPLAHVTPDALLAELDERFNAVVFDLLAGFFQAQRLADFQFDRQAVRVPARLALAAETAHGAVAGENVLHGAGEAVPRVRHPVGRRRTLEENESRRVFTAYERLFVNVVFFPPLDHLLFHLRERDAAFLNFKHFGTSTIKSGNKKSFPYSTRNLEKKQGGRLRGRRFQRRLIGERWQ